MTSKEPDPIQIKIQKILAKIPEPDAPEKSELVAVIPTGGKGTQLSPLTLGMPKALVPINAKPMLVHILESLGYFDEHDRPHSVFKRAIVVGDAYLKMTEEYVKAYKLPVQVEFREIPGTVPQILKRLSKEKCPNSEALLSTPFLLWYSDILLPKNQDWKGPWAAYKAHAGNAGYVGVLMVSLQYRYPIGIVTIDPDTNMATGFREKPNALLGGWDRGNCAVALLSPDFVPNLKGKSVFANIKAGAFSVYPYEAPYSLDWIHVQQFADWHSIQCACHSPSGTLDPDQIDIRDRLRRMKILT